MSDPLKGLANLIDRAEDLLTDSKHPLDEHHAREVALMLQQQVGIVISQMYNVQLEIQRQLSDLLINLEQRRGQVNERVKAVEEDVKEIKTAIKGLPELSQTVERMDRSMTDYPSLTWLLRYRFSNTSKVITTLLVVIYLVVRNYPALAAWMNLPPLP